MQGLLIRDGLSVRVGETKPKFTGVLTLGGMSTRTAEVQARPGYTHFKLDDTKVLADGLVCRELRVAVTTRAIGTLLDVARFPRPKST
jgi:hypothetical protein